MRLVTSILSIFIILFAFGCGGGSQSGEIESVGEEEVITCTVSDVFDDFDVFAECWEPVSSGGPAKTLTRGEDAEGPFLIDDDSGGTLRIVDGELVIELDGDFMPGWSGSGYGVTIGKDIVGTTDFETSLNITSATLDAVNPPLYADAVGLVIALDPTTLFAVLLSSADVADPTTAYCYLYCFIAGAIEKITEPTPCNTFPVTLKIEKSGSGVSASFTDGTGNVNDFDGYSYTGTVFDVGSLPVGIVTSSATGDEELKITIDSFACTTNGEECQLAE